MFGNFSLFKTPFPGRNSVPPSFVSFFCLLYFFLPPFEELGCFSGCLISSAGIQKLFCRIYSMFKCSFDEFVGEKVFSPSYSSAILAPPYSSILAWEIKWTEEPGGLQSMGSQVGHDLATKPPPNVRIITSWSLGQVYIGRSVL